MFMVVDTSLNLNNGLSWILIANEDAWLKDDIIICDNQGLVQWQAWMWFTACMRVQ